MGFRAVGCIEFRVVGFIGFRGFRTPLHTWNNGHDAYLGVYFRGFGRAVEGACKNESLRGQNDLVALRGSLEYSSETKTEAKIIRCPKGQPR